MKSVKILFIALIQIILTSSSQAQLWDSLDHGVHGTVYSLYPDSNENLLYVGGTFDRAGDTVVCQMATWDGADWNKIGMELGAVNCPYQDGLVISIVKWGTNLFASGAFRYINGSNTEQRLIKWDGVHWDSCGSPDSGTLFETTNGQMLGMGRVAEINGSRVGGIAKWNGAKFWEPFADTMPMWESDHQDISSSEYYQGKYYFAGNLNFANMQYREIASWDGESWANVGNGILGDSWVNKLKVFKNVLFIGGEFQASHGNSSSYLTSWSGGNYHNPFPLVRYVNQVRDMQVIDGVLYIAGGHYVWDGVLWQGPFEIAKYDGQEFCSFGGNDIFPRDIAGLNGTLYISTSYTTHPDPFHGIAKWIGGDSTDICISQPVRIQDPISAPTPTITLYPNPTKSAFSLNLPPNTNTCTLKIHDITGREVAAARTYRAGDPPVDVAYLSAGLYFVEVRVKDRVEVVKLVKQ